MTSKLYRVGLRALVARQEEMGITFSRYEYRTLSALLAGMAAMLEEVCRNSAERVERLEDELQASSKRG